MVWRVGGGCSWLLGNVGVVWRVGGGFPWLRGYWHDAVHTDIVLVLVNCSECGTSWDRLALGAPSPPW